MVCCRVARRCSSPAVELLLQRGAALLRTRRGASVYGLAGTTLAPPPRFPVQCAALLLSPARRWAAGMSEGECECIRSLGDRLRRSVCKANSSKNAIHCWSHESALRSGYENENERAGGKAFWAVHCRDLKMQRGIIDRARAWLSPKTARSLPP
jgi:hypothetical protein